MRYFVFACLLFLSEGSYAQSPGEMALWYTHPAATWNEALPIGNGKLGAMIFGGVHQERLQLNEKTVWTGKDTDFVHPGAKAALPKVRAMLFAGQYAAAQKLAQEQMMGDKKVSSNYQTVGDLSLTFTHTTGDVSNYKRWLDLETATAGVRYTIRNTTFSREMFCSAPENVTIIRLTATKDTAISFALALSRPGNNALVQQSGNSFLLTEHVGNGVGVKLAARVQVLHTGGTVEGRDKNIYVDKATAVTIVVTAATDYYGGDPGVLTTDYINAALPKPYAELKRDHIADYQQYFKRVDFSIGSNQAIYFPTDTRLAAMQQGNVDPQLIKLYYQFGRYLLISSSRPGSLPANLQGLWADGLYPPWNADYHININIQMNYWPSEITNLSEMHLPFLQFVANLVPDGKKTARDMYGLPGAVAHFTSDAWHFTEPYGQTQWAMWPMGLAWSAQHLWQHYLFTYDTTYLTNLAYPTMKEAALFCVAYLVTDPSTKHLVSGPSISPENTFKTKKGEIATMVMGPAMDHMIVRDLLKNTIAAAEVLQIDVALRKRFSAVLAKLAPTRIGSDGRIMEWTEAFEEPEPGHRHISHLFGLYPGSEITAQKHPELMNAARKTIDYRLAHGGGHTGWSRAWIINYFARLGDGNTAHENLIALLNKSTLPNLFDNHPPFQIDGNFGATAGITEMLLQSHAGEVQLLPALPAAWPTGHLRGGVARGGFEVDVEWANGVLSKVKIYSRFGKTCTLRYGSKSVVFATQKEKSYLFDEKLNPL